MYGNKSKNLEKYRKSEGSYNTTKTGNQIISGILRELERSMVIVASSIEKTKNWKPLLQTRCSCKIGLFKNSKRGDFSHFKIQMTNL